MKVKINNVALELPEGATLQDALDAKNIPAKPSTEAKTKLL